MVQEDLDIDFPKYVGLDVEPEDRSVGIFGASYSFGFEDSNKVQTVITLDDDNMAKILKDLKPYFENYLAQEEYWKEVADDNGK